MAIAKSGRQAHKSAEYYYYIVRGDGKTSGPYLSSEILQLIAEKQVSFRDYCWRSGYREWRPIISTEDFRLEFKGDALNDPTFPKNEIPNEVERHGPVSHIPHALPEKKKRVIVTFAKTKIKRVSVYEWCFALLFSMLFAFLTANWTLNDLVSQLQQRTQELLVGSPQKVGAFYSEKAFPDYALAPLMSAQGIKKYDGKPIAVEVKGSIRSNLISSPIGRQSFELENVENVELWNPVAHGLPAVYQKPLHVRGYADFSSNRMKLLVSHPGAPIRSP
ncbi:DUF4339 domain-containing protein [bacterium]|nr:DUF4339 domain-containing protein [bacterium]